MSETAHIAEARVATEHASRYLQQLCKHFAHRLPETSFTPETGRIPFERGPCDLDAVAEPNVLLMRLSAATSDDLATLQDVVARHLVRFAFREELAVTWTPAG